MDNSEDLYDEFGNYIGPNMSDSDTNSDDSVKDDISQAPSLLTNPESTANVDSIEPVDENLMTLDVTAGEHTIGEKNIVLHEDKVNYPSSTDVYGPGVVTTVLDEDAMHIETPIVAPPVRKIFDASEKNTKIFQLTNQVPEYGCVLSSRSETGEIVNDEYLLSLLNTAPSNIRGLAVVGQLHCGKTTLVDLLVETTKHNEDHFGIRASQEVHVAHQSSTSSGRGGKGNSYHSQAGYNATTCGGGIRITDTLYSEQDRQLSIKSCPITLALVDGRGKTHCLTFVDCPGHIQFHDESVASLHAMDGAIIMVDVIEGITLHTKLLLRQIISEGLSICLVISKMDRLVTELKLTPDDSYYKIRHLIESINECIYKNDTSRRYPTAYFCPAKGNVAFSSAIHGWCFTLQSFAQLYSSYLHPHTQNGDFYSEDINNITSQFIRKDFFGQNLPVEELAYRLWGETYLDPQTRTFKKSEQQCSHTDINPKIQRTFVTFILQPLYKIYSLCLGEEEGVVNKTLRNNLHVCLSKEQLRSSARPLLRATFRRLFPTCSGLIDMIIKYIPSPSQASPGKVARCYTGPLDSSIATSMIDCNPSGPLVINIVKLYASIDGQSFSAFGRVYSGTIRPGDTVNVLGESYTPNDDEDISSATVSALAIPRARRRTEISMATAGNWVLIDGIDATISKTATVVQLETEDDTQFHIFAPLTFRQVGDEAVVKLAIEPLNPSDLPKMVEGLRRVSKSYPISRTRVEESGEHIVFGTGELYLDCVMHDLRHVYSDIELKVADPVVGFRETVVNRSSIKCFGETTNKRNKLTIIAEPLEKGLAEKLEGGFIDLKKWNLSKISNFFQIKYNWDLLAARSVWAFGASSTHGPNLLMDDTLSCEVDKPLLDSCKSSIVQGFQWAMREGPLCEEPVRSTKIKILDTSLAEKAIYRGGGQIIPTARKVVHSSIVTATPRLMEPIYKLEIQCYGDIANGIHPIVTKRRGHILKTFPVPGSPLNRIHAFLPVIDSFGFETDLRLISQGQAMVNAVFDHWAIVPGDPLDKSIILHPLEPSPIPHLAREFMIKTRRRKGLSEDISVVNLFGKEMREQL